MKTPVSRRILVAKIEAERARSQLVSTATALQDRLKPATLANQAWSGVREKSGELADEAVEAVKKRPLAATGVAAAVVLFLARAPIISAASRLWSRGNEDETQG